MEAKQQNITKFRNYYDTNLSEFFLPEPEDKNFDENEIMLKIIITGDHGTGNPLGFFIFQEKPPSSKELHQTPL